MARTNNAPADTGDGKAVTSDSIWTGAPEGAHPIRPLSEQDWAAVNKQYRAMPDDQKPDPSTVAEIEIVPDQFKR